MVNLFSFDSYYKAHILETVSQQGTRRGYRTQLATAAGCHTSFLSQVLNTHVHLTPDQALGLCQFWSFRPSETDYFLALVQRDRSGSYLGRDYYQRKIEELIEDSQDLSRQVRDPEMPPSLSPEIYYSSWYHAAVFVLLSLPQVNSAEAIQEWLSLSRKR